MKVQTAQNIVNALPVAGAAAGTIGGGYLGHRLTKKRKPGETKEMHTARRADAIVGGAGLGMIGGHTVGAMGGNAFARSWNKRHGAGQHGGGYEGYWKRHGGKPPSGAARTAWSKAKVPDEVRRKAEGVAGRVHRGSSEHEKNTAKKILDNLAKKHNFNAAHVLDHTKNAALSRTKHVQIFDGVSRTEAVALGQRLGVNFKDIPLEQFQQGIKIEKEHAGTVNRDTITIARIARDHLREDPHYYTKLKKVEGEGEKKAAATEPERPYAGDPAHERQMMRDKKKLKKTAFEIGVEAGIKIAWENR